MLPEQSVASIVYDKRLQISREEVCELNFVPWIISN